MQRRERERSAARIGMALMRGDAEMMEGVGGKRGVEVRSRWREEEVRAQVNGWGCAPAKVVEGEDGEGGGVGRADGGAGMGQWGGRTRERETEGQTVGQASTARRGTDAGASREPGRRVG